MFAYIWTEPDTLTEHVLDIDARTEDDDITKCGIRWSSLPDNIFTRLDGSTYVEPDDKPWYYDHDRDDVVPCNACGLTVKSR